MNEIDLLKYFQKNTIFCFHVVNRKNRCIFGARVKDRKKIKTMLPQARYMYTSGCLGMILRNVSNPYRLLSYLCSVLLWVVLSHSVFGITIQGEDDLLEKNMYQTLNTYLYKIKDIQSTKDALLQKYKDNISWLEVYDYGSKLNIRYTLKEEIESKEQENLPLIAKKNGMIAFFECDSGFKMKNVNDLVYKGEILVNNKMNDSYNKEVEVNVNGKVYAYTWQKITVEMKENKLPDAINYFSMLMEARNHINISIEDKEKVEKENILQFETNEGTIKLIILYTLLEDITS